ncbi:hypothetical protein FA15DRAFT_705340 [Coprinopsis marcescibilis]|uniref:Uncharacterized protein n=1 Tax=Coprinopsis marcescibilis TaxID=230819 RepID=A0A5C3KTN6_COPMA|nr:hypothetical protein FA15DRAFT_705340 [Coprinopsis marcescibilis]
MSTDNTIEYGLAALASKINGQDTLGATLTGEGNLTKDEARNTLRLPDEAMLNPVARRYAARPPDYVPSPLGPERNVPLGAGNADSIKGPSLVPCTHFASISPRDIWSISESEGISAHHSVTSSRSQTPNSGKSSPVPGKSA